MYCSNCGKEIDNVSVECQIPSAMIAGENYNKDTRVEYACPRCGHLVHDNLSEEEVKGLSRAAHAEMQRGHNSFASGMGFNIIGLILLVIAFIFFALCHKPSNHFVLSTTAVEFYVFLILLIISVVLLVLGIIRTVLGITKRIKYKNLLLSIQNKTFIQ